MLTTILLTLLAPLALAQGGGFSVGGTEFDGMLSGPILVSPVCTQNYDWQGYTTLTDGCSDQCFIAWETPDCSGPEYGRIPCRSNNVIGMPGGPRLRSFRKEAGCNT